jgi:hypothetical protein
MTKQFSIGDFAMSLIEQNKDEYKKSVSNGLPVSVAPDPHAPDFSKIRVDEDTVTDIFAKSFGIKKKAVEKKPVVEKRVQARVVKENKKSPEQLIAEFEQVLIQARGLIQEMTTCGMLGVNMAGPTKKKKLKKKWKY